MTAVANQYGYWQTGNFANDFKAPAQQASISQDRNTGREGYGYQYYSPGKWGRDGWNKWAWSAPCLFSINTSTTIFLVNNANTVVNDDSNNTWRITKDTGAGTAYNASAVSTGYFAGDFAVSGTRLVTTNNIFFGVNSDPLTDNDYASIDYAFDYDVTNAKWYIYESGVYTGIGALDDVGATLHPYVWRTGTTLGYGVAATLAAAQASPARTVAGVTGNLYFDSSLLGPDTVFQVALEGVAVAPTYGSLSGSSSLVFSPSATLTGTGALSGTSTLVFSPVATIQGLAPVTGTSTLTFTPAATLTGKGALSGTSTLVFTPSATLTGKGALSGTSSLVFSPAGTLTGKGALTGASTLVFAPVATLAGLAPISGASSLTFTPSGTLTGKGALSGTSSIVFTPSGSLTPAGSVSPITGTTSLAFTVSGTLTGLVAATGSATLSFSSAGNISALAALVGSSSLVFTVEGSLSAILPRKFVIRGHGESTSAVRSYAVSSQRYASSSSRAYRGGSTRAYSGRRGR